MAKNRKGAEKFLLDYVQKLDPSGLNKQFYIDEFKKMSDKTFDDMATAVSDGEYVLPIFSPAQGKVKLSSTRAVKVARELGHEIFQRLRLTDNVTGEVYLTPHKYLVIDLPMRRQAQLLIKKMSMPSVKETVDSLTGQVTGGSKGSALSFPELQVMAALGLNKSIEEMMKVRGGDSKAYRQFTNSIIQTGSGSLMNAGNTEGRVKSIESLHTLLLGMHLDNNL